MNENSMFTDLSVPEQETQRLRADRDVSFSKSDTILSDDDTRFIPGAVQRGTLRREGRGVAGELAIGLGRGAYRIGAGVAKTAESVSDLITGDKRNSTKITLDRWESNRQDGMLGRVKEQSAGEFVAGQVGEQLPIIAMSLIGAGAGGSMAAMAKLEAAGTRAAVTIGQMSTYSAWRYGDVLEGIHEASNGMMHPLAEYGLAALSTGTESLLESLIGPEAQIARGATLNSIAKAGISEKLAKIVGEASGKNVIGTWAKGVGYESLTEVMQSLSSSIYEDIAEGPGISMGRDDFTQALTEGLMAIPVAAIFGGVAGMYEYKSKSGFLKKYQDMQKVEVLASARHGEMAVIRLDESLAELRGELAEGLGDEGADSVAFVMRNVSLNWAAKTGNAPAAYVEGFKTLFTDTKLSQDQAAKLRSITDSDQRAQWMRDNVNGFRELEDGVTEQFRTEGLNKQYEIESAEYKKLFGHGFGEDIKVNMTRPESEQTEDYNEGVGLKDEFDTTKELLDSLVVRLEAGEITEDQAKDIEEGWEDANFSDDALVPVDKQMADVARARALTRLQRLRQRAAEEAGILFAPENAPAGRKGTGMAGIRRNATMKAGSSMMQAYIDGKDTSWIETDAMRQMLIEIMVDNHPSISRAKAIEMVSGIPDVSSLSTEKSMLESAFISEMARTEEWRGHYNEKEVQKAVKYSAEVSEEWRSLLLRDVRKEQINDILTTVGAQKFFEEESQERSESGRRRSTAALKQNKQVMKRRADITKAFEENDLDAIDAMLDAVRDEAQDNAAQSESIADEILTGIEAEMLREENRERMGRMREIQRTAGDVQAEIAVINKQESDRVAREETLEDYRRRIEINNALRQLPDQESAGSTQTATQWADWFDQQSEDFRDNYDPFKDKTSPPYGYDIWEARNIMPKSPISLKKQVIKRVSGDYSISSEYGFIANVNGKPYGVNYEDGMDGEKTWFFSPVGGQVDGGTDIETAWTKDEKLGLAEEMMAYEANMSDQESADGGDIYAIYQANNPEQRLAVFFKNATEEDVIHEWFHHIDITGMLPSDIRTALDKAYGINPNSTERELWLAREYAARDFLVSLRATVNKQDSDESDDQKKAFGYLRNVFASEFHATKPFAAQGGDQESGAKHVSPRKFSPEPGFPNGRFNLDKVGTGQGDAYHGFGIYFGDADSDLSLYKGLFSKVRTTDGSSLNLDSGDSELVLALSKKYDGNGDLVIKALRDPSDQDSVLLEEMGYTGENMSTHLPYIARKIRDGVRIEKQGTTSEYNVDIPNAMFEKMVDYDAPLSDQNEQVKEAAREVLGEDYNESMSGRDFYIAMRRRIGDKEVSAVFAEKGIVGLHSDNDKVRLLWDQGALDQVALLERNGEKLSQLAEPTFDSTILLSDTINNGGAIDYNPETRSFFEEAFAETKPEEIHKLIGEAINNSFSEELPGKSARMFQMESSNFGNQTDETVGGSLWKAAHLSGVDFRRAAVASILEKETSNTADWESLTIAQKQQVALLASEEKNVTGQSQYFPVSYTDMIAQEKFGKSFKELGQTPEGLTHQKQIIAELKRTANAAAKRGVYRLRKRSQREGAVKDIIGKIAAYTDLHSGSVDETNRALSDEAGLKEHANYIATRMNKKGARFSNFLHENFDDLYAYIRNLDDGDPEGIFGQEIGTLFHIMNQGAAIADDQSADLMKKAEAKHGPFPRVADWNRKFGFGSENIELTVSEAIGVYLITDRGRNKDGKQALIESNSHQLGADINSVISSVKMFVESSGDKGYSVGYKDGSGIGDYTFDRSKNGKPGYKKTNPAKNFIKAWRDVSKELHTMADKTYFDQTGIHLPFSENYFPFFRMDGSATDGDMLSDLFVVNQESRDMITKDLFAGQYGENITFDQLSDPDKASVMKLEVGHDKAGVFKRKANTRGDQTGALKERTATKGGAIMLDAAGAIERYRIQMDIYRSKANALSVLNGVLSSQQFKASIEQRFGSENGNKIIKTIASFAEREKFPYGRVEPLTSFDMKLKTMRSNAVLSVLALKIPSMLRQTVSGLQSLAEISPRHIPKYFGNFWASVGQVSQSPTRILDSIGGRHNPFTQDGPGKQSWDLMKKYSPEITKRYADPDIQDIHNATYKRGFFGGIGVGKSNVAEYLMGGFRMMDLVTVTAVYGTAFESKMYDLKQQHPGATDAWLEESAGKFAGEVVSKTQPASGVTDRNLIQTGSEVKRAMFMFTGQLMKNFQYMRNDIAAPLSRGWANNGVQGVVDAFTKGEAGQRPVMQKAFFSLVLPSMMLGLIARRRLPEDEEEMWQDLFGYNLSSLPLIGPIMGSAVVSDWRGADGSQIYYKAIESAADVLHDVARRDVTGRTAKSAINGISLGAGIPLAAVNAITETIDGYTKPEHDFSIMKALSMRVEEIDDE